MQINLVTNHTNGAGLQKDSDLMTDLLEERGHQIRKIQHDFVPSVQQMAQYRADVTIYLEVVNTHLAGLSPKSIMVPNSEWWQDSTWGQIAKKFTMVLCKTVDCYRIWATKLGASRCRYIGWEAPDRYLPEVPRELKFLHTSGKSVTKNTAAVMSAWKECKLPYPITVSAFKPEIRSLCEWEGDKPPEDRIVNLVTRFDEADMPTVLNEHLFHIMPSKYEGFGMAIHEALGCGGVVLTTDAAPMRDFSGIPQDLLIPVSRKQPCRAAVFNHVDPRQLAKMVHKAAELPHERLEEIFQKAREGFLADRHHFRTTFPVAMKELGL